MVRCNNDGTETEAGKRLRKGSYSERLYISNILMIKRKRFMLSHQRRNKVTEKYQSIAIVPENKNKVVDIRRNSAGTKKPKISDIILKAVLDKFL